jgi:RNA polymerase sigma-70 factor, ECF subfamily
VCEAHDVILASPQVGEFTEMMTSTPAPAGFAGLYERHYEAVFRTALRVTGRATDAEDVLQTVFLRVLSGGDEAAATGRPVAYFRRAAVNAAVDLLRRRAVHDETAYDDRAPHAAVEPALLLKEQLRRAIATLERDDATLFLLRYVEGLSNQELADMFQLEKNNVAVRLHRIRLRLQVEMER